MADSFGFDREIILAISDFSTLQPRLMQAVASFLADEPARGRVDQSVFFLYSPWPEARACVDDYLSENPQSGIPVVFSPDDVQRARTDSWAIRNAVGRQLHIRDLFDYQLPLNNGLFFFGRESLISEYIDASRKSQNRGLFGLRKTGKTSFLFKIRRLINKGGADAAFYYDCKSPAIRELRWNELLGKIIIDIVQRFGIRRLKNTDSMHVSDHFVEIIRQVPRRARLP